MAGKPEQLFEYLYALHELKSKPIRDYQKYDQSWETEKLPAEEGCFLFQTGKDEEAWLEVHKQEIDSAPRPDKEIRHWLNFDYENENAHPQVYEKKTVSLGNENRDSEAVETEKYEYFHDDSKRVEQFKKWQARWTDWAVETQKKRSVQELYSQLFAWWQAFQREDDVYEIAFGHGLLTLQAGAEKVHRPVLVTNVELDFDSTRGIFYLRPSQKGTHVELDMLSGLEGFNVEHLEQLKKNYEENPEILHPLSREVETFYKTFVQTMHANGVYVEDHEKKVEFSERPMLYQRSVIFIRKRGGQLWKEDLRKLIEGIKNHTIQVPKTIKALITDEESALESDEEESTSSEGALEKSKWASVGEDLYFPLPSNEEQKEIVRRVSQNIGVTVQGPPGTGKSHTIANLIAHFLAHGLRVLVTSQTGKALSVLAEKIPESIRALCVPYLGGDTHSIREVESSINQISEKMGLYKTDILAREIKRDKEKLHEVRKKIRQKTNLMIELRGEEEKEILWNGEKIKPGDAAKKLNETEVDFSWIRDEIEFDEAFPLSQADFRELWRLRNELTSEDIKLKGKRLPVPDELLSEDDFRQWVHEYRSLHEQYERGKLALEKTNVPLHEDFYKQFRKFLTDLFKKKDIFENRFLSFIVEDGVSQSDFSKKWPEFTNGMKERLTTYNQLAQELIEYEFQLPEMETTRLEEDLKRLKEHFENGGPDLYFWIFKGRKIKYLRKHCFFDNRPVRSCEDVEKVEKYLEMQKQKERIIRVWNKTMQIYEGPKLDEDDSRFALRLAQYVQQMEKALSTIDTILSLKQLFADVSINMEATFQWSKWESLKTLGELADHLNARLQYEKLNRRFRETEQNLESLVETENMHPIAEKITEAFKNKNTKEWEKQIKALDILKGRKKEVLHFEELTKKLADRAPLLAEDIRASLTESWSFPADYLSAWEYRKLDTWLKRLDRYQPESLQRDIHTLQNQERQLIRDIVTNSAWKAQIERTTESQKNSLKAWKTKIKRYGKGTGKYAAKHRKEARQEMNVASGAIPVWIMPVNRVLENFSLEQEKFDVVIVDESSQCDLFSLQVLMRANKAVVVGDDEQISPEAVGIHEEKVNELIRRFLEGIPRKNIFDLKTSLFELSDQIFPKSALLMLREHFRSVPEIIQFSNDLCYDGSMIPLRLPSREEKMDKPVLAKFISTGYREEGRKAINLPEAEAIVTDLRKMVEDSRYAGQTMGIISLQGDDQARLIEELLREHVSAEEIKRRRIYAGNAYTFQGDERDIIFLSLVVAPNQRFRALTKNTDRQRFNVAASRARNQMRLYHSVRPEQLNQDDLRYRLLHYCLQPTRIMEERENVIERLESPFEKEVARRIIARGYRVTPQLEVGRYRIDMVVEGIRQRLAIECDGARWHDIDRLEQDRLRQEVLERAGWTFWRIRGSKYYRDPDRAMQSLWDLLDEMGIQPEKYSYQ